MLSSDPDEGNELRLQLVAFKHGASRSLIALKHPIGVSSKPLRLSLRFFSSELVGEVTGDATYTLAARIPEVPFAGHCGLVSFYNTPVLARDIQIEEIAMSPKLPETRSAEMVYRYDVFVSHASADIAAVRQVIAAFRDAGISYWVDHEQIGFGDPIVSKIEDGLQSSRHVVVCLSKNLGASTWCRAEYGPILYREYSGKTERRVLPLIVDGDRTAVVPLLLSDKLSADLTNPSSFADFIRFLKKRAG
jgi:hypothetical protein